MNNSMKRISEHAKIFGNEFKANLGQLAQVKYFLHLKTTFPTRGITSEEYQLFKKDTLAVWQDIVNVIFCFPNPPIKTGVYVVEYAEKINPVSKDDLLAELVFSYSVPLVEWDDAIHGLTLRAVNKVMGDLTENGYDVFEPRIQCNLTMEFDAPTESEECPLLNQLLAGK